MAGLSGEELLSTTITSACILVEIASLKTLALDLESSEISGHYAEEAWCPLFFLFVWLSARATSTAVTTLTCRDITRAGSASSC